VLELEVPGQPVPQPRPRFTRNGKPYYKSDHPIHAYRHAIGLLALGAQLDGALSLTIEFIYSRPASHWRAHGLRPNAPAWPRGDGDNLAKGVADALKKAGTIPDDDNLVRWSFWKRFAARNEQPRTIIRIEKADI
jgi:Holliday junction resolvase RusA-like endonuclease